MSLATLVLLILSVSFNKCTNAEDNTASISPSSAGSPSSSAAFSSAPDNVRKVRLGEDDEGSAPLVAVTIPEKFSSKNYYPNLKLMNDSTEINDGNETIADDSTMISGVASKFGKRAVRSLNYQYPNRMGLGWSSSYGSGGRRYNKYYPVRHPNSIESYSDGPSSSSSWGGKWLNQLRRRTSMMMSPDMTNMDKQQMQMMDEGTADEPDMAGSFLGGWGQGYGNSKVNKSAVGLLGFLSLLSLIQNVLNQTMPMTRRRRDVSPHESTDFGNWNELLKETTLIAPVVLPMLNAVNWAKAGDIRVDCTLQPICLGNQVIVGNLGERGKSVGVMISDSLAKLFPQTNNRLKTNDFDLKGKIIRAGMAGRNLKNCRKLYPTCLEPSVMAQVYKLANIPIT